MTIIGYTGIFAILLAPILLMLFALRDLGYPPTKGKALGKIVLGVAIAAVLLRFGNYSAVAILLTGIGVVVSFLGIADMAACRKQQ